MLPRGWRNDLKLAEFHRRLTPVEYRGLMNIYLFVFFGNFQKNYFVELQNFQAARSNSCRIFRLRRAQSV